MYPLPNQGPSTFVDRWEELKPVIEQLYLVEKKKLSEVVTTLKNEYRFDAVDHQYKHHFKKWKWKKSIPKAKKEEIAAQLESRARAGKMSTAVSLYGRPVEQHKMRRFMKLKARDDGQNMALKKLSSREGIVAGPVLPFANSIFLKWNIPYAAMRRSHVRAFDQASPFGYSIPTPGSDIVVATPSSAASPRTAPSPNTLFVRGKLAIDRAHMFAQGHHDKLLMSMDSDEKRIMSEWLYQYWFFCFKTAKSWGRGPQAWTAQLLDFARFNLRPGRSLPGTPGDSILISEEPQEEEITPTDLCSWLIHVNQMEYDEIPEVQSYTPGNQDPNDESTWSPWSREQEKPPLSTRLWDALEHNDFSSIPAASLPVAMPQVAKAAARSPDELLLESLGFSIMSRNTDQVRSILSDIQRNMNFESLYPLHMAASYVDGSKACCDILLELAKKLLSADRGLYVNDLGHTVLDSLMISILRSHSSTPPVTVDDSLKDNTRFIGDEVDICGRWDADSPCVRRLLATGNPSTPFAWKHKFCHTSIQAICHCIMQLGINQPRLVNETPSGLYVQRCFDCGTKLQLQPFHTLVMTAYHLADKGCQDEDLFGMLACLLCFISCGFDPSRTGNVSITSFLPNAGMDIECDHEELTPSELAEKISENFPMDSWGTKVRTGWAVFCGVLRLCENLRTPHVLDVEARIDNDIWGVDVEQLLQEYGIPNTLGTFYDDVSVAERHLHTHSRFVFGFRKDLATLWASVQVELLAYRRIDTSMDWISQNFSMTELESQIELDEPLSVGYAKQGLLNVHCLCGRFDVDCIATLPDVTKPEIANLDIWDRATYASLENAN